MTSQPQTLQTARQIAQRTKTPIRLLEVEEKETSLIFYYRAPEQTNFRALERELNRQFKVKIEFREVSNRTLASQIPGCGRCGRPLCCRTWLTTPLHIPTQLVSSPLENCLGSCGKLLCCLAYETENPQQYVLKKGEDVPTVKPSGGPPQEQSVVSGVMDNH